MTGKVILLGADGFIGRHIAIALRQAGYAPLCVARRVTALAAQGYDVLRADLGESACWQAAFWRTHAQDAVGVVNAAGLLDGSAAAFQAVHVDAPKALYAALPAEARIVLISAIGLEADTRFARFRQEGEAVARQAGRPATILRPGLVMGDTSYGGSSLLRALAAIPFVTPVVGDGAQVANPMHAADLAELVVTALRGGLPDAALECGGAESLTQLELTQRLRGWMGQSPVPVLRMPLAVARVMGAVGSALKLGPISRTAVAQLEQGIVSAPAPETTTRPASAFLSTRPAGTQDLWHARLYLMRPLVRLVLAVLWFVSALLGLFLPAETVLSSVDTVLSDGEALALGRLGGVVDLGIAAALLMAWRLRAVFWVQMAVVLGYTVGLTVLDAGLWLDPFGGLLKNLPILALLLIHRVLEEER